MAGFDGGEVSSSVDRLERWTRKKGAGTPLDLTPSATDCHIAVKHVENRGSAAVRQGALGAMDLKKWVTHPFAGECLLVWSPRSIGFDFRG